MNKRQQLESRAVELRRELEQVETEARSIRKEQHTALVATVTKNMSLQEMQALRAALDVRIRAVATSDAIDDE